MTIKYIRTISDELIATVVRETEEEITVKDVLAIFTYQDQQTGKASMGFGDWLPYVKGPYSLNKSNITIVGDIIEEIESKYRQHFSGIIVPKTSV